MGDVLVKKGTVSDGRIAKLEVELHGLGTRVIDRETALAWLEDGHSLVPWVDGKRSSALQLVDVPDDEPSIRTDNAPEATDSLGELLSR
jgi:hypothetical protein